MKKRKNSVIKTHKRINDFKKMGIKKTLKKKSSARNKENKIMEKKIPKKIIRSWKKINWRKNGKRTKVVTELLEFNYGRKDKGRKLINMKVVEKKEDI